MDFAYPQDVDQTYCTSTSNELSKSPILCKLVSNEIVIKEFRYQCLKLVYSKLKVQLAKNLDLSIHLLFYIAACPKVNNLRLPITHTSLMPSQAKGLTFIGLKLWNMIPFSMRQ